MNNVYKEVALELGLSEKEVTEAYKSMWRFMRETIKNLDVSSKEKFEAQRTNFNIPRIGKLFGQFKTGKKREENV